MTRRARLPKSRDSRSVAERKSNGRSRVSNGHKTLPDADGRSMVARRYRDIASAVLIDQNPESCSEARKQLIRRFAASCVLAEQLEAALARGEDINVEQHALLVSSAVRITRQLGLGRIAKNVTPSLDQYLANRTIEAAE
jgi:hypothetical protein